LLTSTQPIESRAKKKVVQQRLRVLAAAGALTRMSGGGRITPMALVCVSI
jgi:hypothetical protein